MRKILLASALVLALGCTRNTTSVTCPVGAAYCSGSCSSLQTDATNCGACGRACPSGQSCVAGGCTALTGTCSGGLTSCGSGCVDLATSVGDCGACGHVCPLHQDCRAGACTLVCQADLALCGSECVNLASDPLHCGACGTACAAGGSCQGGVCKSACGAGFTSCNGTCVNTATDAANCGACGVVCASGTCAASVCAAACDKTSCGGACVDLQTDRANCGACGHACVNGEECGAGICACGAGYQTCGSGLACIDVASDGDNCGTCATACPRGQTCQAGACVSDVSAFRMLGGDAAHSGLNAGETGVPPLVQAWVARGAGGRGPPVVEGGRVLSLGGGRLWAHEATNGAELWSYNFGSVLGGIGWPAVSGGQVYVATSNSYGDTWLRQFDRAGGTVGFKVGFGSQWEQYWSPIVVGDVVYTNGGTYGGLYGFDAAKYGAQTFFNSGLEQYDEWSPAFFGGKVYTFVAGKVRAHDPTTGTIQATLDVGWTWAGWSMASAPAFGATYGYVISPPNLFAFDPATMKQVWAVNDAYRAYPAVAAGTVFAISNGNLHALDATTGARKWLFTGDDHLLYPPVVAAGYAYVSSATNVYAVSLATHLQVWTAAVGGRLAIGAGMLFVSRDSDGSLVAFRLTR